MTQTRTLTDFDIKNLVVEQLRYTPSVNSAHVGVAVNNAGVLLSGSVASFPERHLAEQSALRVRGVNVVANEITVRNADASPSDADIASGASQALRAAVDVPVDCVHVVVSDHVVTLSGAVQWQFQRLAAERSVRYLRGIADVRNWIQIREPVAPAHVQANVEAALARDAQLALRDITVVCSAGSLELHGTVRSQAEKRGASKAAWSVEGVTSVENVLHVEYDFPG